MSSVQYVILASVIFLLVISTGLFSKILQVLKNIYFQLQVTFRCNHVGSGVIGDLSIIWAITDIDLIVRDVHFYH